MFVHEELAHNLRQIEGLLYFQLCVNIEILAALITWVCESRSYLHIHLHIHLHTFSETELPL